MQDPQAPSKPGNWVADLYRRWPQKPGFNRVLVVLLLMAPVLLWLLPADFFDDHGGPALCPSKWLLGIECPGCGLTRAVMHFHHLDLAGALYYHLGVIIVYPLLGGLWLWLLIRAIRLAR